LRQKTRIERESLASTQTPGKHTYATGERETGFCLSEERIRRGYGSAVDEDDEIKEPRRVSRRRLKELIHKIAYPRRKMLNY
jgi:hypothetical protein